MPTPTTSPRKYHLLGLNDGIRTALSVQENEVYVPNWANHMGMNDRFALLHPKTASVWKGRLDHALTHCLEEPVHSETFVRHFAASNSLQVPPIHR